MYYQALSLAEIGECDRAIVILEEVLAIDARFVDAYAKLGSIYNILGDTEKSP